MHFNNIIFYHKNELLQTRETEWGAITEYTISNLQIFSITHDKSESISNIPEKKTTSF